MSQTLFDSIECISTTNIFSLLKTKMEPTTQFEIVVKKLPHRTYSLSHGLFKNSSRNWCWFLEKTDFASFLCIQACPQDLEYRIREDLIGFLTWCDQLKKVQQKHAAWLFFSFHSTNNQTQATKSETLSITTKTATTFRVLAKSTGAPWVPLHIAETSLMTRPQCRIQVAKALEIRWESCLSH